MENTAALLAAIAASVAVYAHGVAGHRWFVDQLNAVEMRPTPVSVRLFGPGNVSAQVFGVTWHVVTLLFLASAVALYLTAFGALESRELLRFIALVHAGILCLGLTLTRLDLRMLRAPIPIVFSAAMTITALGSWIASNSV